MATIKLKQLEVGAVLSDDVADMSGRVLLRAGAEVTEKHLQIFRTWGVTEVSVVGDEIEADDFVLADLSPELLATIQQQTDSLFRFNNSKHEMIAEVVQYQTMKLAKAMLQQG